MHFQLPPYDHAKLIYCLAGSIKDVLLDLRRGPNYGRTASVELNPAEATMILIPKGIAHGFLSCENASLMVYKTTIEYMPSHDTGIRWDSFDFDWGIEQPVVSERDNLHQKFSDFTSPF
jgi:dTDP-4-dehydrorhamnose 3,5-epimerase/CDP-3, 6-dideoxy-D-glycero-D-glycero-4-hexulose-5-epimerase